MALTHIIHRIIIAISHQAALVQNSHVMHEIGPATINNIDMSVPYRIMPRRSQLFPH